MFGLSLTNIHEKIRQGLGRVILRHVHEDISLPKTFRERSISCAYAMFQQHRLCVTNE
jgi:hypothetical protein